MVQIDIPVGEQGTTRVFSLSSTPAQALALKDSELAQMTILGVDTLNMDGVELFPLSDLGDLGLIGYLREGSDAHEADLNRDGAKLAALEGWVMLVHSLAFGGNGASLTTDAALTLIGTYGQVPATRAEIALPSEAAEPYSGNTNAQMDAARGSGRQGAAIVVILILLVALILWAVLT